MSRGGGVGDGGGRKGADVKPPDKELKGVRVILWHCKPVLDRLLEARVKRRPEEVRDAREEVLVQSPLDFARAHEHRHDAIGEQSGGDEGSVPGLLDKTPLQD